MHDSIHKSTNCGVPEGSILGPLLFILHIIDIVNTTSLPELFLFTDATILLFSHPDIIIIKNVIINSKLQGIMWLISMLVKPIIWCSVLIIVQQNSLIQVRARMHNLNNCKSNSSRNVEKINNILLSGVSSNRISSTKYLVSLS